MIVHVSASCSLSKKDVLGQIQQMKGRKKKNRKIDQHDRRKKGSMCRNEEEAEEEEEEGGSRGEIVIGWMDRLTKKMHKPL